MLYNSVGLVVDFFLSPGIVTVFGKIAHRRIFAYLTFPKEVIVLDWCRKGSRGVVVYLMDYSIEVSEFKLH